METIEFIELQRRIAAKKAALGLSDEPDDALRNSGIRRTPAKRAFLARIADRCRQAGIEPLKANY